jgi:hypothetical protein
VSLIPKAVAPSIVGQLLLTPSRTSIAVRVGVDKATGFVVCGCVVGSSNSVPSEVNVLSLKNPLIPLTNKSVSYTLSNLIPSLEYDVYCATYSSLLVPSSYSQMLSTKATVSTVCCRLLQVNLLVTSFSSGEDVSPAMTMGVSGVIPSDLSVGLVVTKGGVEFQPFLPSVASMTSLTSQSFAFVRQSLLPAGVYTLAFRLSGDSAPKYSIQYSTLTMTVLSTEEPPPTPKWFCRSVSSGGKTENRLVMFEIGICLIGWGIGSLTLTWLTLPKDDGSGDYDDEVIIENILMKIFISLALTFPIFAYCCFSSI